MTSATSSLNDQLMIFSGSSHPALAKEIADYLKLPVSQMQLSRFSSGEIYARVRDNVRGKSAFVVQSSTSHVNEDLMELFIIIDSLKRASARSVTAVLPSYPYARQDKKSASREPISARLIADLLAASGIDRLITMDLHSDQIQGFFNIPVDHLTALSLLANYLKDKNLQKAVVVAPDTGRAKTAKKLADRLDVPLAIMHKRRPEHQKAEVTHIVGDVEGRTAILVDDMVDTAGTVASGFKVLRDNGAAADMYLVATHGILSGPAAERLKEGKLKEVIFTNSVPVPPEKQFPGLHIISAAPLLGEAIQRAYTNQSISSLFD
jgi:ribose-phosphate pyrophosphokinase